MATNWLKSDDGDANHDGVVDIQDISYIASSCGRGRRGTRFQAVPEPATYAWRLAPWQLSPSLCGDSSAADGGQNVDLARGLTGARNPRAVIAPSIETASPLARLRPAQSVRSDRDARFDGKQHFGQSVTGRRQGFGAAGQVAHLRWNEKRGHGPWPYRSRAFATAAAGQQGATAELSLSFESLLCGLATSATAHRSGRFPVS